MASLNSRLSRLEKMAPDVSVFPDPPRFAGRPHEVAVAEHIEWLQELLVHPHIPETGHSNIRSRISQL